MRPLPERIRHAQWGKMGTAAELCAGARMVSGLAGHPRSKGYEWEKKKGHSAVMGRAGRQVGRQPDGQRLCSANQARTVAEREAGAQARVGQGLKHPTGEVDTTDTMATDTRTGEGDAGLCGAPDPHGTEGG